jgi:hypothetical protein
MNQFTTYEQPTAYPVMLNLAEYKMWKRLRTIDRPTEVILFMGISGCIYDISVAGKREHLTESS